MNPYGPDGRRRRKSRRANVRDKVTSTYRNAGRGAKEFVDQGRQQAYDRTKGIRDAVGSVSLEDLANYFSGATLRDPLVNQMRSALDFMPETANRLAGSQLGRAAIRTLPATAAVAAVLGLGDIVLGGESFANDGMDLLGMGVGAYGMRRGRVGGTTAAGRALQYTSGAVLGKIGSDTIQAVVGNEGMTDADVQALLLQSLAERGNN